MDWKTSLKENAILISDGAWGTELAKRGLEPGTAPELWNVEHPDAVEAIPAAYVAAGSDIILSNTFGGSRFKLEKSGLADRVVELNREGAARSRHAAGERALVFASVGPTGEFLPPLGTHAEDEFFACFKEQIGALIAGGADGIVIETMSDLGEAKTALRAARECGSFPVVVSMTFERGPKGFATMMGVKPEVAAELEAAGADIVGANCGSGIDQMIEVATLMRGATRGPLWIKPNAGMPEIVDGKTVFRETAEEMASKVQALIEAGANIIGGCCGTTPEHIQALAAAANASRDLARRVSGEVLASL